MSALPQARTQAARSTRDIGAERILAGIGLVLLATACFATLDTATAIPAAAVPILMGVWFRYAFQALATATVLLPRHGTGLLRTENPLAMHLCTGRVGALLAMRERRVPIEPAES